MIGIIENISGFICPKCGEEINIFKTGWGRKMAEDLAVPFLGSSPIDPEICTDSDGGKPFIVEHPDSPASKAFTEIVKKMEHYLEQKKQLGNATYRVNSNKTRKIRQNKSKNKPHIKITSKQQFSNTLAPKLEAA